MRKAGIEVEVLDEAAFKRQYGKPGKLSQSSTRKSLGRGSSIKDGAKPSGYESPKEFRSAEKKFSEDKDPCWDTHKQVGMKKKGGKMVPNCVPKGSLKEETIEEATRVPAQNGNVYLVGFTWRGKYMMMKIFFPEVRKPARSEVQDALEKVYPGSFVKHFYLAPYDPSEPMLNVGVKEEVEIEEDWQKVNKSDKTDGMSKKAVAAYRRENPGSKLKTAVTGDPNLVVRIQRDASLIVPVLQDNKRCTILIAQRHQIKQSVKPVVVGSADERFQEIHVRVSQYLW